MLKEWQSVTCCFARFSFSGYGLQECAIRRDSGTLDLLAVLEKH
jgi:hypothetical protein